MGYFTEMICPWDKKREGWGTLWLLEGLTIKKLGAVMGRVWGKNGRKAHCEVGGGVGGA